MTPTKRSAVIILTESDKKYPLETGEKGVRNADTHDPWVKAAGSEQYVLPYKRQYRAALMEARSLRLL